MIESEYENVFRRKELSDIYASGEVSPSDDIYLIEDTALTIQELNKKLDFYSAYKKKRAQDIADEMKVIENKILFFKDIILATLKKNNEKSVKFPGSCSVTSKNQKQTWSIDDEEEFIAVLQEAQKAGENVDDVLESVTQYNVRKREAYKLLDTWEKSGKLSGFLSKAKDGKEIVSKVQAKTTVSLSFADKAEEEEVEGDISIPIKKDLNDFDSL